MSIESMRHKKIAQCCALSCAVLLAAAGIGGCKVESNGDGSSLPLSDLLGSLGTTVPPSSGNDGSGNSANESDGSVDSTESGSMEAKVLERVNNRRGQGADCGSEGTFPPAGPLTSNDVLATVARDHSIDMSTRGFFDHTNPDGVGPGDRVDASGYEWSTWGENIAAGQQTPEDVVESWMNSDGHCSNIMDSAFTEIGVGYAAEGFYWTQVFGAQR